MLMLSPVNRLPVDFLLGRVQEPVGGGVHEWIQEHQARLQLTFEGAQERLKVAAERRKQNYDQHVRDAPLKESQLVLLRELGQKGRSKIKDLWSSVMYTVLKAPKKGGSVYTIAPVNDQTKVKQVHRSLLKAVVTVGSPVGTSAPLSPPPDQPQSEDELSCDDLFVLRRDAPCEIPTHTVGVQQTVPRSLPQPSDSVPTVPVVHAAGTESLLAHLASPPATDPDNSQVTRRRTTRSTAGQHSNVYHLPRSVGNSAPIAQAPPGPVVNAVSAFFRPWS